MAPNVRPSKALDWLDAELEEIHRHETAVIADARKRLMKLKHAELIALAQHYGLKCIPTPAEIRRYGKRDTKEGLCDELAPLVAETEGSL